MTSQITSNIAFKCFDFIRLNTTHNYLLVFELITIPHYVMGIMLNGLTEESQGVGKL